MSEVERWRSASTLAGLSLEKWYMKHPKILRRIAPLLPVIVRALKEANLNEIEKLLQKARR